MSNCQLFLGFYPTGSAQVLGVVLDLILFGILTVQTYIYYLAFPKDGCLVKIAVVLVYSIGMAQTGVALRDLHKFSSVVRCPGAPFHPWPKSQAWFSVATSSAIVAWNVQCFYAYRLYIISRRLWTAILIATLSLGQLASGIIGALCGSGIKSIVLKLLDEHVCTRGFDHVWGPLNVACDVTITFCMVILLFRRRKGTVKKTTYARITRIIYLIVEAGLATSITVIIYTAVYNLSLEWFVVPGLAMGKVYSNSMLALLNNRLAIVDGRAAQESVHETYEMRSEILSRRGGREFRGRSGYRFQGSENDQNVLVSESDVDHSTSIS